MDMYNLSNIEAQFKLFLISGNVSSTTVRNYLSDLRFFLGWSTKNGCGNNLGDLVNEANILKFKNDLIKHGLPEKTINRRLSTLRKLWKFIMTSEDLASNPVIKISNISKKQEPASDNNYTQHQIIDDFKYCLILDSRPDNEVNTVIEAINELLNSVDSK